GGASNNGTVFEVSTMGAERVVHSFKGKPDGAHPSAGLYEFNGTLYGTTSYGGAGGNGTVFAIKP
ncbi:MAG TPA: choice-of-anchor tandem repeat GloVer-containing protein, partial [Candidatus Aquilonibacter sp.]